MNSHWSSELLLTSNGTFSVTGSSSTSLSQFSSTNLTTTSTAATDSVIYVDGQKATNSSNTLSNVLPGLTMNLQSASPGTTVNVGVSLNTSAITSTVSNFVNAYNSLHQTTQSLGAFGGVGGTNGALIGDPTLEIANNQIRQMSTAVVSSASGAYNSLATIGVSVDQDGVMSLDSVTLNAALTANIQSVSNVFSSTNGIAVQLNKLLSQLTGSGGTIGTEESNFNSQLTALQTQTTDENKRLDAYKASLQAQFTAMETIVGQYHDTSSFLTSWVKSNSSSGG